MQKPDGPLLIVDVLDFYRRWPALRERVLALIEQDGNQPEDTEILHWMVQVIDRIGPNDVR